MVTVIYLIDEICEDSRDTAVQVFFFGLVMGEAHMNKQTWCETNICIFFRFYFLKKPKLEYDITSRSFEFKCLYLKNYSTNFIQISQLIFWYVLWSHCKIWGEFSQVIVQVLAHKVRISKNARSLKCLKNRLFNFHLNLWENGATQSLVLKLQCHIKPSCYFEIVNKVVTYYNFKITDDGSNIFSQIV